MRVMIVAFALGICALPAAAQSPDPDDKRFTLHKVEDGYLRLDGRNGAVSLCTRPDSGWVCRAVPDERSALESEIGRIAAENAELKRTLLDRGASLPGLPPRPPADVGVGSSGGARWTSSATSSASWQTNSKESAALLSIGFANRAGREIERAPEQDNKAGYNEKRAQR
jgi:hypothetical protein